MKARIQKVAELLAALTRRGRSHTNPADVGKQWGRQGGDGGGGGGWQGQFIHEQHIRPQRIARRVAEMEISDDMM